VNPDMPWEDKLRYVELDLMANAPATRYDFDFRNVSKSLNLRAHRVDTSLRYDVVYLNDPMLLRHYRALFHLEAGYMPKFVVHSHFIDNPECPKFPTEESLWHGQCEAAIRADHNFWQCESAMHVFFESMRKTHRDSVVDSVIAKSFPYDDGYSIEETTRELDQNNLRFTNEEFKKLTGDNVVIFVPNRVGGKGRSSDYTQCGKFLFDVVPKLASFRNDFVIIAGNPSQKFSNAELKQLCPQVINIVDDTFTRDEYLYVARNSDIVVGLYAEDAYGGTASRECIESGCVPFWCDNYEYSSIAKSAGNYPYLCEPDLSDAAYVLGALMENVKLKTTTMDEFKRRLQHVVRNRCSYESTTPHALKLIDSLS